MAQLVVENGPQAGTAVGLAREQPVTVGTGEDCQLRLQDPAVARHQAVIKALKGKGFGVKSLGPGLRVNGDEVEAARLEEGDVLELGGTRIRYHRVDRPVATRQLGGFRILEELGRGGMGVVYRAEQISLNRQVALKVLPVELTADPVFVARFVAEARAAGRLHHPNVVQVFDVDHEGDTYFYSMELLHEGSLEQRLRQRGRLSVEEAIQAVADAAAGLGYAESLRIVHRDIKPDNLMVDQHGTVKIADLGLALDPDQAGDKVLGTPHFMSPEQVLRRAVDHRSDLYALGCTFYRLITGRTPFSGSTVKEILRAHVKEEPEPAHKVEPDVPPEVSAIIQKLMAKEPDARYQSAAELLEQLRALLAPPSRRLLVFGSIALALAVAGAALAYGLTRDPGDPGIIVRFRDNPEALRLARVVERQAATIALQATQLSGLEGLDLAAALEEMAERFPDSDAAGEARALAADLRAEEARRAAVRAAREEAIEGALAAARQRFRDALAAGAFRTAREALRPDVAGDLAGEPRLAAGLTALEGELQAAIDQRLSAMRSAVDEARAAGDPEALAAAVQAYEAILGPDGWPAELVPTPTVLRNLVASWREEIAGLEAERERRIEARGWERYGTGLLAVLEPLAGFDLEGAADRAEVLAGELGDHAGGARAAELAALFRAGAAFQGRVQAAAADGSLDLTWEEDAVPVMSWQPTGAEAGLTVNLGRRSRPRPLLLAPDAVRPAQWRELAAQIDAPAPERRAFLATGELLAHLREAEAYLGRIRADVDGSGTGDDAYPLDAAGIETLLRDSADEPWSASLRHELRAASRLVAGLRAISQNRARAGAAHLERLLAAFPRSLVVLALR